MSNDSISRQAAIDAMEKCIMDCNPDHFVSCSKFIEYMHDADIGSFGQWQFANGFNMGVTASKVAINVLQSEQPEHKRGKWIKRQDVDGVYWTCSECGGALPRESHFDPQFDLFPRLESIEKTDFCPSCGADMREESEDE